MSRVDNKIVFSLVYEKYAIPDKGLYIKRVMDSCKTHEQLKSAYLWGRNVIKNLKRLAIKDIDRCGLSAVFKFYDGFDSVSNDLSIHFNKLTKEKFANAEQGETSA